ncbi:hypothetical protein BgiMline_004804, partial [Biomphalaria glabrata]
MYQALGKKTNTNVYVRELATNGNSDVELFCVQSELWSRVASSVTRGLFFTQSMCYM